MCSYKCRLIINNWASRYHICYGKYSMSNTRWERDNSIVP
jgi:hypothetical protein